MLKIACLSGKWSSIEDIFLKDALSSNSSDATNDALVNIFLITPPCFPSNVLPNVFAYSMKIYIHLNRSITGTSSSVYLLRVIELLFLIFTINLKT